MVLVAPTLVLPILPLLPHLLRSLASQRLLLLPLPVLPVPPVLLVLPVPPVLALPVAVAVAAAVVILVLGLGIALELVAEVMTNAQTILLAKVGSVLRRRFLLKPLGGRRLEKDILRDCSLGCAFMLNLCTYI